MLKTSVSQTLRKTHTADANFQLKQAYPKDNQKAQKDQKLSIQEDHIYKLPGR